MGYEALGLDFDGVIRKWPGFVAWYANFLSPNDLLIRARLRFIRDCLIHIFMDYLPIILDGELIEAVKNYKPNRLVLISGRCGFKRQEVKKLLKPYLKFDQYYFREDPREPEEQFKERICKIANLSIFIEDRRYVVEWLRKKGVRVYHISEIRG